MCSQSGAVVRWYIFRQLHHCARAMFFGPDVAGFSAKTGMLIPPTNTMVESDYGSLAIFGVVFHAGRNAMFKPYQLVMRDRIVRFFDESGRSPGGDRSNGSHFTVCLTAKPRLVLGNHLP